MPQPEFAPAPFGPATAGGGAALRNQATAETLGIVGAPFALAAKLVEAAGFRKITQRVDEWGIFTVSLAQKI